MSQCRFTECADHGVGVQYKSVTASCRDWQHGCLVLMSPWVHVSATQALILDDFLSRSRQNSKYCLKFSHDRFHPHPSSFITASSFYQSTLVIHRNLPIKGKGLPQQAEVAQRVPGRLRPRVFLTFSTTRVVGRQSYPPAAFTPRGIPGTHF